ncbi:MAG: protein phosphatase 2C domain-containing protein [bacterium]
MNIHEYTAIGNAHRDHNEDSSFVFTEDNEFVVLAVMDGCSSGTESYFASGLIRKLLKKNVKQLAYLGFVKKEFPEKEVLLKTLLFAVFEDLKQIKQSLYLSENELLSTLLLSVYNISQKSAITSVSGDGFVFSNNSYKEFDSNNKPDYMAYHLNDSFEKWYACNQEILHTEKLDNFGLSTDGIKSFYNPSQSSLKEKIGINPFHYFFFDEDFDSKSNVIKMRYEKLKNEYGIENLDDIAMIRLVNV